jgi:fermentation-respiration switch protein FrsA (DUF1100 family)
MPFFPVSLLLSESYENVSAMRSVPAPAFFVLAERDEVVTFAEGKHLFDAYRGPKQKFTIPGIQHNEVPFGITEDWVREFRWFLKRNE